MKNKKRILIKIITTLLLLTLILSLGMVAVSATDADLPSLTEPSENTETSQEEADRAENLFAVIFSTVKDKAAEIFSVLTLISSLILAYAYKKGLFPLIKSALTSLNGSVNKIKESAESELQNNEAISAQVKEKLSDFEKLITAAGDRLALIESKLDENKNRQDKELKTIISAQIDMLYDVFMSSSLPQYQKDAIGQRVVKMKEALGENEAD